MQSCVIRFEGHVALLNVEYLRGEPIAVPSGQQEGESFSCSLSTPPPCMSSEFMVSFVFQMLANYRVRPVLTPSNSWDFMSQKELKRTSLSPQDKASDEYIYRHTRGGKLCPYGVKDNFLKIIFLSVGGKYNPYHLHYSQKVKNIWLLGSSSYYSDVI